MGAEETELACVMQRLDNQERELAALRRTNKRWRAGMLLVTLGTVGLLCMAAARPAPTIPDVIKAHKFEAIDSNGVARATLDSVGPMMGPALTLKSSTGTVEAKFQASGGLGAQLDLYQPTHAGSVDISTVGSVSMDLESGVPDSSIMFIVTRSYGAGMSVGNLKKPAIDIDTDAPGNPSLTLRDAAGFSSILGSAPLVTTATGETHQTSAASLTMFNKKGNVIWQAPNY